VRGTGGRGLVVVQLAAFWPVWPWLAARLADGGEDGAGLLAAATALAVAVRGRSRPDRGGAAAASTLPVSLTLAYAAARHLGRDAYIMQATMDTRPEDLIVTPVVAGASQIKYVASPVVTAMLRGGVCILDEGNRMSEKSWASLAPLLDNRRYVESIVAGIKIPAHRDFRICATMNDDASTFEIPEYIHSRIQPQIFIDFPDRKEEMTILRQNLPFVEEQILTYVVDFLQKAHDKDERFTVRDGINVARYAAKVLRSETFTVRQALSRSVAMTLGEEASRYLDASPEPKP
jgi:MoxR-like ATPase